MPAIEFFVSPKAFKILTNPDEHGRSSKWPALAHAHLKAHPKCEVCGTNKSLNVHHIKPFKLFPELELEPTNLFTLCETPSQNHHFLFGHLLDWKAWNPSVIKDAIIWAGKISYRLYTQEEPNIVRTKTLGKHNHWTRWDEDLQEWIPCDGGNG